MACLQTGTYNVTLIIHCMIDVSPYTLSGVQSLAWPWITPRFLILWVMVAYMSPAVDESNANAPFPTAEELEEQG